MSVTYVSSGAVTGATLAGGNQDYVLASGTLIDADIVSGGGIYVYEGGVARATTIAATGFAAVQEGGTGSGSVIDSGGREYVYGGGLVSGAVVNSDGGFFVSGSAAFTTIDNGGAELVNLGATQSGTTIFAGGVVQLAGTEYATTIASGGALYVARLGADSGAIVGDGGFMEIAPGGAADGLVVQNGGLAVVLGDASGTVQGGGEIILAGGPPASGLTFGAGADVLSSGVVIVSPGHGQATPQADINGATLTGLATVLILSGGAADQVLVGGATTEEVFAGGTANDDTVTQTMIAFSGGTVGGTLIDGGGLFVSGATVFDTTARSAGGYGGYLDVFTGTTSGALIEAGGSEVFFGTGTAVGTTIESGGFMYFYAAATAQSTTLLSGGSEMLLNGGIAGDMTLAGGTLQMATDFGTSDYGTLTGTLDFTGGTLIVDTNSLPTIPIAGFGVHASIEITNLYDDPSDSVTVGTPGFVTIVTSGSDYQLNILGATAATPFALAEAADGDGLLLTEAPCFAAGTRILTPRGDVLVEALSVGDLVITNDGEDAAIVWIGRRRIDISRHPRPAQVRPVRIAANALGEGVPVRDLLLSPDHAVFLDNVLIPAKTLINDRNICRLERVTVSYFHIELAEHGVIFAENCAVETYLETGNRGAFENGGAALALHPDFAQTLREQQSCAPFVITGPVLEAARARALRQFYAGGRLKGVMG